jgi:glycosyltransferase involved in cell wall biosynthesis
VAGSSIPQPTGSIKKSQDRLDEDLARRTEDWIEARYRIRRAVVDATSASIVMATYNQAGTITAAVESVRSQTHPNWELIIVNDGSTDATRDQLGRLGKDSRIKVITTENSGVSAARNRGLAEATGDIVFFLDSDNTWSPDHLRSLIVAMDGTDTDCAYTALNVVDDTGATQYVRGDRFDWDVCRAGNYVDLNVFALRRERTVEFEPRFRRMVDWDYILRATRSATVTYVPVEGCRYVDSKDASRISNREPLLWDRVLRARHGSDAGLVPWHRIADDLKLSIAIKIPAPRAVKDQWGDYHFAVSLQGALQRLGHDVRVDFLREWDSGPADVNLVLRGLSRFDPPDSGLNVMWNISHPDGVSHEEYTEFDIVYVASESYARLLSFQIGGGTIVLPLLQATDTSRFNPERRTDLSNHASDVLFVGNTRDQFRDIVRWAVEAQVDVRIHGQGWSQFLPADLVSEADIPNEELGAAYASSGVVLNDHWPSMRDFGIISNRVFDVVATGTRVISDQHPALARVFDGAVSQVDSPDSLRQAIEEPPRTDLGEVAEWVLSQHSFDARARQLVSDLFTWMNLPLPSALIQATEREKRGAPPRISRHRGTDQVRVGAMVTEGGDGPQSSAFIRLFNPLSTEYAVEHLRARRVFADGIPNDLDVCVIQRTTIPELGRVEGVIDELRSHGTRLIVDVDDAFNLIGRTHPEYERYQRKSRALEYLLQHSDQQWFATQLLLDGYAGLGLSDPQVVRNALDPRMWRRYDRNSEMSLRSNKRPRILYMGTATHDADFAEILPELRELHTEVDFELVLVGALRGSVPEEEWLSTALVPPGMGVYPRFARWLKSLGPFDVGISPLEDTPFNRAKSDIKFLDYSALSIVSVLADLPPYRGEIVDRQLALLAAPDEWANVLASVLSDSASYADMRERATDYVWTERSTEQSTCVIVDHIRRLAGY